jgi:uncharacterized membrane protein YbhN (UPF0104 family)
MSRHAIITGLKAVVTLGALAAVASRIDLQRVWETISVFPPAWVPAMAALLAASLVFGTLKWQVVLHGLGRTVTWIRLFFNTFLPGRTGGDIVRAVSLARSDSSRSRAVASVAVDRGLNLLALLLIGAAAAIFDQHLQLSIKQMIWAIAASVSAGLVIMVRLRSEIASRAPERFRQTIEALLTGSWDLSGLVKAGSLAIAVQITMVLTNICAARAMGLNVTDIQLFIAIPLTAIITALPVSINGLGIREAAYATLLALFGIPAEQAVALSLVMTAAIVGWSLIGGLIFIATSDEFSSVKVNSAGSVAR